MKQVDNIDDHLVVHDAASITVAGVLGLAAGAITQSPEAGVLAAATVSALGIGSMRLAPVRRGVNRAAITVAASLPKRGEK
jgi:hypothetical protein